MSRRGQRVTGKQQGGKSFGTVCVNPRTKSGKERERGRERKKEKKSYSKPTAATEIHARGNRRFKWYVQTYDKKKLPESTTHVQSLIVELKQNTLVLKRIFRRITSEVASATAYFDTEGNFTVRAGYHRNATCEQIYIPR